MLVESSEAIDDWTMVLATSDGTEIRIVLEAPKTAEEPNSLLIISVVELIEIAGDSKVLVVSDPKVLETPVPDSTRVDDGWSEETDPDSEDSIEVDGIADKVKLLSKADELGSAVAEGELDEIGEPSAL
ncbi:hypothetical protein SS1G_02505 [Sclerotinia sclerotiorum 1980 UF-70]|uniref:Uncharacterized protein n=1 Tax=Sclerotinia sclerotiorum (strain ATCC 18683 / 1980 / Ss-1) TaxID=665079 RepID=A7EB19_SCLS1|nr:hypothetical protein SS1G_02505 [Sclerotinia sclerotiorum 1980 UF-70]EDN99647.1 hypothetical protein SS1G_02505 [Sclerotinia sclerotiorum 1980 UF-70]